MLTRAYRGFNPGRAACATKAVRAGAGRIQLSFVVPIRPACPDTGWIFRQTQACFVAGLQFQAFKTRAKHANRR